MRVQFKFVQYPEPESPHKLDFIWEKILEIYNDPDNNHPNVYCASTLFINNYINEICKTVPLNEITSFITPKAYKKYAEENNSEFIITLYKAGFIDAEAVIIN